MDVICVLCRRDAESRDHLFFDCSYTSQIWEHLMRGVLRDSYTTVWSEVIDLLMKTDWDKRRLFCLRYAFQAAIHMLWRERNKIKHGETPLPMEVVKKLLEKGIRNKLSILRYKGGKGMENALQYWFSTRV